MSAAGYLSCLEGNCELLRRHYQQLCQGPVADSSAPGVGPSANSAEMEPDPHAESFEPDLHCDTNTASLGAFDLHVS